MKISATALVALLSGTTVMASCLKDGYCAGAIRGAQRCDNDSGCTFKKYECGGYGTPQSGYIWVELKDGNGNPIGC
ncbi:uncharacterized protein AB675_4806 [Cyphellophora attinorum]|uniref:Uncharacterized protein n=1 Tax=Cyphellophora attinorum TaxID=1664694 RepID=A0A0N0NIB0_9EURO|nr:uncharacterized protein AB675_4806 [Phialophora attinorum]KPI35631.1 hypothetical protein AB675_4806 [Phialophora attinorum]